MHSETPRNIGIVAMTVDFEKIISKDRVSQKNIFKIILHFRIVFHLLTKNIRI